MQDGKGVLSDREVARRAIGVITAVMDGRVDNDVFRGLIGETYEEAVQVCVGAAALAGAAFDALSPAGHSVPVAALVASLDELSDEVSDES